ncbi:MAG: hypothetical protein K1X78_00265 [Verrucomicrobiaceae bacterium]|nr:hypothetical protein [Verrucomicrobiaceae bacterium]
MHLRSSSAISLLAVALICGGWSQVCAQRPVPKPGGPATSPAPPPDPAPLKELRQSFLNDVLAGSQQLTAQFSNALVKLEDELALSGDYEDAMQVQKRRREIDAILSKAPAETGPPGIPMTTSAAKTSSSSMIDGELLTGWRTSGSYAEWAMQKLTPGRYAVQFSYVLTGVSATTNGESSLASRYSAVDVAKFKLTEVSLLASAALNTRLIELNRTADALTYATVSVEPLSISHASITLRLEAMQGYPANTIRIKDVRLVPVEDKPSGALATITPTGDGTGDLEALRQVFLKQLAAARTPLVTDYLSRLKTLAAQPSVLHDKDLLEDIESEKKRVSAGPASTAGASGRKRGGPPVGAAGAAGLDGWEDLSGVRLAPDSANTTGRFKVTHDGREFWVKLAWVHCLPASEKDKDAIHAATRHFKISEEDALSIGRVAQEFARGYLEDRPLRLLVRGKKDREEKKDDAAPALVFLEDLGLFQTVLVDHGFAGLAPPEGSDRKPLLEGAMLRMLGEHEQQAMKRSPAPGAWSFRNEEDR